MALQRAAEHHHRQRLVELHRRDGGEGAISQLRYADLHLRGAVADVEADRQAGLRRRRPQPIPGRIGDAKLERTDDRAAVTELRATFELSGGGLGRERRQHRQHAQPGAIEAR